MKIVTLSGWAAIGQNAQENETSCVNAAANGLRGTGPQSAGANYFLPFACARALAAMLFVLADERPSLSALEACFATLALVTLPDPLRAIPIHLPTLNCGYGWQSPATSPCW